MVRVRQKVKSYRLKPIPSAREKYLLSHFQLIRTIPCQLLCLGEGHHIHKQQILFHTNKEKVYSCFLQKQTDLHLSFVIPTKPHPSSVADAARYHDFQSLLISTRNTHPRKAGGCPSTDQKSSSLPATRRNLVERICNRIEQFQRMAIHYGKRVPRFMAKLHALSPHPPQTANCRSREPALHDHAAGSTTAPVRVTRSKIDPLRTRPAAAFRPTAWPKTKSVHPDALPQGAGVHMDEAGPSVFPDAPSFPPPRIPEAGRAEGRIRACRRPGRPRPSCPGCPRRLSLPRKPWQRAFAIFPCRD